MTHPFAMPSLLPHLPTTFSTNMMLPIHHWRRGQYCLLQLSLHYRPPALLVSFPTFGARRVAPASDNNAVLPWWRWLWDNCVPLVPLEAHDS
eukprot:5396305-Ditylum_brightwellii.AAC.1